MLSMPILNGRIGKWILALSEFELKFESAKAIKGQIIADFITEHRDPSIDLLEITPWALFFDGSSCGKGGGVGILLISPRGEMFEFAIPIQPTVTNNHAEYEALLRGLQYLREARAVSVEVYRGWRGVPSPAFRSREVDRAGPWPGKTASRPGS
jgi:hypothetical protein